MDLVESLAQLAFENPELILLLRGQSRDYLENGRSTLFPTMFRSLEGERDYHIELMERYRRFQRCDQLMFRLVGERLGEYSGRVARNQAARWALLQHYDVCATPLLDVTHSPLVAASFALANNADNEGGGYLFVLGVPQLHGSITVSSPQAIQIIRLASVCPPETLRPYIQEGYLIGNYPPLDSLNEKTRYDRNETDCARRLVAKFELVGGPHFWNGGFRPVPRNELLPEAGRSFRAIINQLKEADN